MTAKGADIGSKRLISLAPDAWARWLLGDDRVEVLDVISADFQWVSRETDVLLRARLPDIGEFLVLNELQLRYDVELPRRIRAYAALAEERYKQPVFPVLVNLLEAGAPPTIPTRYHSEFMGLVAQQDYRVINLWEVDAGRVLAEELLPLLPFVPLMKGGQAEETLVKALTRLRSVPSLAEMELLLAFFARFVVDTPFIRNLMRWDMKVLTESPWYQEIIAEGIELGLTRGLQEGRRLEAEEQLLLIINHRFSKAPESVRPRLTRLDLAQLHDLFKVALDASTWAEFEKYLAADTN